MNGHLEHRRHRPHLSLLELHCPCCERPIVPSVQLHECARHSWSRVRRYLVGWFCDQCRIPFRVLRLYASDTAARDFLATLQLAALDGWQRGHPPDLPDWVLPGRGRPSARTAT